MSFLLHKSTFPYTRAQNNGRSTDNDRPKMPLDRSLFYLTGHFDRPHFHLELKHETMMYRNKFLIVCFTVSVSVSMTGQKQILTELKSSDRSFWPETYLALFLALPYTGLHYDTLGYKNVHNSNCITSNYIRVH